MRDPTPFRAAPEPLQDAPVEGDGLGEIDETDEVGEPQDEHGEHGDPRRWFILVTVLLGHFIVVSSLGSLNVALPTIQAEFDASPAVLQWLVVLYQISYATVLAIGGRLGDLFGRRRLFLIGISGFALSSLVAAVAPAVELVVACRLLQGVFGGLSSPQVLAMIQVAFPPRERPKAFAAFGQVSGAAFVLGQLISGALIQWNVLGLSWRNAFYVNVVVGMLVLVAAIAVLREVRQRTTRDVDLVGMGLTATAGLLILFPIIQGREAGWPLHYFAMLAMAGPVIAVLLRVERRVVAAGRDPILNPIMLSLPSFRNGVLSAGLFGFMGFAPFFLITVTLQTGFGMDPLATALATTPGPVAVIIMSFFSAHIIDRIGARIFMLAGAISIASYVALLVTLRVVTLPPHPAELIPALALVGCVAALVLPAGVTLTLSDVPSGHSSSASGMYQTVQQSVGALGVACFGTVFFSVLGDRTGEPAFVESISWAMTPAFITSVLLLVVGFRLRHVRISAG
ncbi:MAG: MFS transporter [Acidimicrobiales bacterium]